MASGSSGSRPDFQQRVQADQQDRQGWPSDHADIFQAGPEWDQVIFKHEGNVIFSFIAGKTAEIIKPVIAIAPRIR